MTLFKEFKGRHRELNLLDALWASPDATLLILYGRRRVGKTRLITQWIQQRQQRALYWVADPASALDHLRSFSQAVYTFANPQAPAPLEFTYATWQQAWQQVANLAQTERLALFIDEFTYVLEIDPSVAGVLQNMWDHVLKQSNLFLTICGSHLGMMQRHLLSYQAPLYGRATRQLHLRPIPFGYTQDFFPDYQADERVAIYAIFGGIPAYWERLNPQHSIADNIRQQLLTPDNVMQSEPRLLLQDFIQEPHNYVSILRAIAQGDRAQKAISTRTGLAQGHVSKYLSVLREAGFVERRVPVTASESSRLGRYHIVDPYLRFYYRFLATRQAQLALGETELALTEIKRHLLDFIATHTWEELCREWTLRAGARGQLSLPVDQVGSAWTRQAQVDVVALNSMTKTIVLGECKWQTRPVGEGVLQYLVQKTGQMVPKQGQWRVLYLGFAREGWTHAAQTFAGSVGVPTLSAPANWQPAGMVLLSLSQVDTDLHRWARYE
ncbi:MAG TPA: ATP-binding protein [Chloroflexota bacterium]|nr:ATP-binding protein [Chloroflexota bacterium]HUM67350.1 ATP-binding protein [Chloroflexota bacterium]